MENMKKSSLSTIAFISITLMLVSLLNVYPFRTAAAPGDTMNFATGETIDFTSTTTMSFWSGVSFQFGTGIIVQFIEMMPNGVLEPCDVIQLQPPYSYIPHLCEWWEVLDPQGNPTGIEFHIDGQYGPFEWHIDNVLPPIPMPLPYPPGAPFWAEKKIDIVETCNYFYIHEPVGWYPRICTWWEIMNPETYEPTGVEFHIDWTNESCEFHVDGMINGPYILPFPWPRLEARQKIVTINPCDWFYILDPPGFTPTPGTWWEVLDPNTGAPTGLEFYIDIALGDGRFHVEQTDPPGGITVPMSYPTRVRQKVSTIEPCTWFIVDDPANVPKPCTWWKIVHPAMGDVEFHVDASDIVTGSFHIDTMLPPGMQIPPTYQLTAEKKFEGISPCDWFRVETPNGFLPTVCSWWRITWPTEWAGVEFHVDSTDGIDRFHIDQADPLPLGPTPPPWNVTAEEFTPEDPWYYKPSFVDYVPSGMPDFDERQWGTYNWSYGGAWSHCGPVAVANSLWWLDSEFESSPIPPPTINDHFSLVAAFGPWDDHDSRNVAPLVEKLAWFMDTDGILTHLIHKGTSALDMQAGLTHYLSWSGVNPQGDVNGDGYVNQTDMDLVTLAFGSVPGAPNWNMAADLNQDNVVNAADATIVGTHFGQIGRFYEHTVNQPEFRYIEQEVERCQDVVLSIGYYVWTGSMWYREDGHFVTVAGVDSADFKLAISDPIRDAFENGLIPEGRIPIPHPHMPPEPPYTTHNDAAYVSQDIYSVVPIPPVPPGLPGIWALANFPPEGLPFVAVIEDAVITSPLGIHDIAVTNLTTCKDGCKPMRTLFRGYTAHVNVTVVNDGNFTESFSVTAYANTTVIGTQVVLGLGPSSQTIVTFVWNASGYAVANYTLSAYAAPVLGETDTADNSYTDGIIKVVIVGDINGDNDVDIKDVSSVAKAFGTSIGQPLYNPNGDFNDDHEIDIKDVSTTAKRFGDHYP
jgi:hypothetical protein